MRARRDLTFELERFEWIPLEGEAVLMRVAGRWRSRRLVRIHSLRLVVATADGEQSLEQLPDPGALPAFADAEPPPWRAGFALAEWPAGARFALRTGDGRLFELPAPTPGKRGSASGAESGDLDELVIELESDRARTEEALELASRRLEQEIERRQAAEREAEELRGAPPAPESTIDPVLGAMRESLSNGSAPRDLQWVAAEAIRRARTLQAMEQRLAALADELEEPGPD